MEVSFQELKCKQVINTVDGKCLGHFTDVIFDAVTAKTLGFIVPNSSGGFLGLFKQNKDLFIPFDCICKIGVDVILVELYINEQQHPKEKQKHSSYIDINKRDCSAPQNVVCKQKNN